MCFMWPTKTPLPLVLYLFPDLGWNVVWSGRLVFLHPLDYCLEFFEREGICDFFSECVYFFLYTSISIVENLHVKICPVISLTKVCQAPDRITLLVFCWMSWSDMRHGVCDVLWVTSFQVAAIVWASSRRNQKKDITWSWNLLCRRNSNE